MRIAVPGSSSAGTNRDAGVAFERRDALAGGEDERRQEDGDESGEAPHGTDEPSGRREAQRPAFRISATKGAK